LSFGAGVDGQWSVKQPLVDRERYHRSPSGVSAGDVGRPRGGAGLSWSILTGTTAIRFHSAAWRLSVGRRSRLVKDLLRKIG
jgi:hypothetical protein